MEIQHIKKQSAADLVCESIKNNIVRGKWSIGQKIPSEADLSNLFGVNRSTVRAALQKLSVLGLIDTRVGEGSFVKKLDFAEHISYVSDFYLSEAQERSIVEFRKIIEVEAAMLAMERATKDECLELERLYWEYKNETDKVWPLIADNDPAVEEKYLEVCKYDLAFHEQIVLMSHNEFLHYAFSLVQNSISLHILALSMRRVSKVKGNDLARLESTAGSHKLQLDAILSKNPEAFRKAYLTMTDNCF